jgi:hypothetical protein
LVSPIFAISALDAISLDPALTIWDMNLVAIAPKAWKQLPWKESLHQQRCIIPMNDYHEWSSDRSVIQNATAFPLTATVRLAINLAQIAVFLDAFDGGRP